jgi:hypothetical protein
MFPDLNWSANLIKKLSLQRFFAEIFDGTQVQLINDVANFS